MDYRDPIRILIIPKILAIRVHPFTCPTLSQSVPTCPIFSAYFALGNQNHSEMKYADLTHRIIGCAMEVHSSLGNGFQEVIYQRALAHEMKLRGISFKREVTMPVYFKDKQVGSRRVDFLIENLISTELKATIKLEEVHLAQGLNYLEAYNLEVGLLLNFGAIRLEYKRLLNRKYDSDKGMEIQGTGFSE